VGDLCFWNSGHFVCKDKMDCEDWRDVKKVLRQHEELIHANTNASRQNSIKMVANKHNNSANIANTMQLL
jgi:hypothetical protein